MGSESEDPYSLEARLRELDVKIAEAFHAGLADPVADLRLIAWRNRLVAQRAYLIEARRLLEAEKDFATYVDETAKDHAINVRRLPEC